jgi:hypothetical protein
MGVSIADVIKAIRECPLDPFLGYKPDDTTAATASAIRSVQHLFPWIEGNTMVESEYTVDLGRCLNDEETGTGIYIRAKLVNGGTERWVDADLVELDKASVLAWLRSRGGDNPWAENCVGILLGHGPLHEDTT